jgi:hypothetical protein
MKTDRKIQLLHDPELSSQYLGVGAGLAPAKAGNRKGLPLRFEKIHPEYRCGSLETGA